MADIPDPRLQASQPALSGADLTPPRPLSRSLLILLTCGTVGGLLYTTTYLIEGVTRPDYDAWQQTISTLSLGPGGWVQHSSSAWQPAASVDPLTSSCSSASGSELVLPRRVCQIVSFRHSNSSQSSQFTR